MGSTILATNNQSYIYTDNPYIYGPTDVIAPLFANFGIDSYGFINCCYVASLPSLIFI